LRFCHKCDPPDGRYNNFTTAEACDALNSVTSGSANTALGWGSLFLDSIGSFNTGVGGGALALNNADSPTQQWAQQRFCLTIPILATSALRPRLTPSASATQRFRLAPLSLASAAQWLQAQELL